MEDEPQLMQFTPEIIDAVVRHMNDDHASDQLAMVRHHALPDATSATLATIGEAGLAFDVETPGGPRQAVIAWPRIIADRADIRRAVVELMPKDASGA